MGNISYQAGADHYALLGVSPAATAEEISRAHRRLAKECHPDVHPDKVWATERFKQINQAYAVLSNPADKGEYDRLRWAEIGAASVAESRTSRPQKPVPVKKPKGSGRAAARSYHQDRIMSYFILGIEVVVMAMFLFLGIYAALKKLNG
ncbi:MAG: J domain-containing protein [Nitrospirota bacterium]|nr:J domain-containing protein [Nitrospirota bacterium]